MSVGLFSIESDFPLPVVGTKDLSVCFFVLNFMKGTVDVNDPHRMTSNVYNDLDLSLVSPSSQSMHSPDGPPNCFINFRMFSLF